MDSDITEFYFQLPENSKHFNTSLTSLTSLYQIL